MSAEGRACESCRHFNRAAGDTLAGGDVGECRRNAPFFPYEGRFGVFVIMPIEGWCGEFELPLEAQRARSEPPPPLPLDTKGGHAGRERRVVATCLAGAIHRGRMEADDCKTSRTDHVGFKFVGDGQ